MGVPIVYERRARRRARLARAVALALLVAIPAGATVVPPEGTAAGRARSATVAAGPDWVNPMAARIAPVGAATSTTAADRPAPAADEVAITPPPPTFDAPAAPAAPPPPKLTAASTQRAGGVWAVVIGVDDYPGTRSDLRASVNDANDVDAALGAYGVAPDRRLVLRDRQVTAATLVAALRWLVDRAAPDATAVIFYAGHVRKTPTGEAIVTADGDLVRDWQVADALRDLQAQRTWIALASCYAGGFTEVLAPGRILTAAADSRSLAYESSRYGRSYLVEYMVRRAMLQGQAAGSVEEAFGWAVAALRRDHPNRVPVQHDGVPGELRLGEPPPRAAAPPPAAPSQPAPSDEPQPPPPSQPPPEEDEDDNCLLRVGTIADCD